MIKTENFSPELQKISGIAKALAHPARLMILEYLVKQKVCISGDITREVPLSRTTVSQHLNELKKAGLVNGSVEGLNVNYCLNPEAIRKMKQTLINYLDKIDTGGPCLC
ncbi:MAG: helix-turn-helix transcriptional regulator [Chlorobi bacterium]|nr:helix-turn-helix transcriptional regulator [Chlorobiota bacterium]